MLCAYLNERDPLIFYCVLVALFYGSVVMVANVLSGIEHRFTWQGPVAGLAMSLSTQALLPVGDWALQNTKPRSVEARATLILSFVSFGVVAW
jgi:hypothetical protein